jgi:hypothetical protein
MAFASTKTGEKAAPKWTARPDQSVMLADTTADTLPAEIQEQIDAVNKTSLPAAAKSAIIDSIRKAAKPTKGKPVTLTPYDPIPGAGANGTTPPMSWKLAGIGGGVWMSEEQWLAVIEHGARIKAAIIKRRDS